MDIIDDQPYSRADLQEFLRREGIPASRPTIAKYEKLGLIPSHRFANHYRLYMGSEIKEIIKTILSKTPSRTTEKVSARGRKKARA